MFPPGPMKVLNIKLKGTGGERSFPVVGDLHYSLQKDLQVLAVHSYQAKEYIKKMISVRD